MILSVTTIDSQSVSVTWKAPTQPNGVLISYTITYTTGGKTNKTTISYGGNVNKHCAVTPIQNSVLPLFLL